MSQITRLNTLLVPHRDALIHHPVYAKMQSLGALQVFMEHHVFAVWDFMSLLKALQQAICCTTVPWIPPTNTLGCRMINDIVRAEESDEDGSGNFASHFDLYRVSMEECGADITAIDTFINQLRHGTPWSTALDNSPISNAARDFVRETFAIIQTGDLCAIASAFTFGREDLLPDVFQSIVNQLNQQSNGQLRRFQYYLERHIGLDGDEHGPMATRLIKHLCGDDIAKWKTVEETAVRCLIARKKLWDAIDDAIDRKCSVLIA